MAFNNPAAELVEGAALTFAAVDHGLQAWTYDPVSATASLALATAGTVYVVALKTNPRLISNIVVGVQTAGGTLTASQCFAGLYQNGALLGSTADQSGVWNSTGVKTMPLASPVNPLGGLVYAAFVFNGTTGPALAHAGAALTNAALDNVALAATVARFGTANTGVTTALPATLGAVSALSTATYWVGLS